ncbi:MAG TPA: alpha/beta fold hydrolase [Gemmatimonadota bacterium]|nr:alpha/beta fold hydrolase [Gemmatimonadota bacterium]
MRVPGTFTFAGPAGRIEAIWREGADDAPRAAVVCHPLPSHGGSMHNKVVYRAAKAFESMGWPVLRFNFRGVGLSEGEFAGGAGEAGDVRAAIDWLAEERPGLPLVVCGFSFGNAVGLPVGAPDERVSHLVGLGTPTDRFPFHRLADVGTPKLFVQGDRDEFGPLEELRAGLERVAKPWDLVVIEGADHFFTGRLEEMQAAIVEWFSA